MKRLLLAIVALAVIAIGVIGVGLWRLDPEALGARFIERINKQSGIRVEAERFSLQALRGLEMIDAEISGEVESGRLHAQVARVRMKHQVLPLLWGVVMIDEILLVEPAIDLVTRKAEGSKRARRDTDASKRRSRKRRLQAKKEAASGSAAEPQGRTDPLRLSIESLAIQDGSLSIHSRKGDDLEFLAEELNLVLGGLVLDPGATTTAEAVSGQGNFDTGRIAHGDLQALRSGGRIRIAAGMAELTELEVRSANADLILSRLTVNLLRDPPTYTILAAGGLDLNGVLDIDVDDGFGPVGIDLGADGKGPDPADLVGQGTLTLNEGAIPGIPSVLQIEEWVGQPLLTGRRYRKTPVDYTVAANKVLLEPFEIVGEGANIGGSGEIDLSGPVSMDLFVRLPGRGLASSGFDEGELEAASDEDGWVTIPFHVSGTIAEPSVELTWDGMKAASQDAARGWVEEALDEAKKRADEWLRSQSDSRDDG